MNYETTGPWRSHVTPATLDQDTQTETDTNGGCIVCSHFVSFFLSEFVSLYSCLIDFPTTKVNSYFK